MRGLAMRFRGILRSKNVAKLGVWLTDAHQSGLYAMQRFARTLRRDIDAVRSAVTESWSNGQTVAMRRCRSVVERAPTCLRASRSERPPANRQGSVDNIDVHFVDIAIDPQKAIRKFDNLLVRLIIAYNA
jgi:hypothetical protein